MLKNKFIIISFSLLLFFIILFFSSNVKAVVFNTEGIEIDTGDIELYEYTIVYRKPKDNYYRIYSYDSKPYIGAHNTLGELSIKYPACNFISFSYIIETNTFTTPNTFSGTSVGDLMLVSRVTDDGYILLNDFDLCDTEGNVVFPRPVLTLAEVLEKEKPAETFQTMMSGIIPYLLVFLIGLVAFWKAWQLLSKELRKA